MMTATSYDRGHKTYYDGEHWRYFDNNQVVSDARPCARCGKKPTDDGHDACIGTIIGAKSVCCGHGVSKAIIVNDK